MEVDEVKQMHLNARGGERWRGSAQWIVRGVLQPETQDRRPVVDAAASHVFNRNTETL